MTGDEVARQSIAEGYALITDHEALAAKEAANAIDQFDRVLDIIEGSLRSQRPFRLRPSMILSLHGIAMDGVHPMAGTYRNTPVGIGGSKHTPPREHLVPSLMEEMCDWIERYWNEASAIRLCAYAMWRLNWIHPFADGNGRTSRAVAYLVLCIRSGVTLPGLKTIPEQIAEDKAPYYAALERLDDQVDMEAPDLAAMETLLENCLAYQLKTAFDAATSSNDTDSSERRFH